MNLSHVLTTENIVMAKTSIQINSVVVCEDIRREDSGKAIFIGVYPGDITAHQSPANLVFSFWFDCFTKERTNEFEVEIILTQKPDGSSLKLFKSILKSKISEKTSIKEGKYINFALIGLPVTIEKDSTLVVSARPIKGRKKELSRKSITLSGDPSEVVQPS